MHPQEHMLQVSAGDLETDDGYGDGNGDDPQLWTPAMRSEAARQGQLNFMGVLGPQAARAGEFGFMSSLGSQSGSWIQNFEGSGYPVDSYVFGYEREGYDPVYGYGSEASRPPDPWDPEDQAAYPHGVVYEDEPGYSYSDEEHDGHEDGNYCEDDVGPDAGFCSLELDGW